MYRSSHHQSASDAAWQPPTASTWSTITKTLSLLSLRDLKKQLRQGEALFCFTTSTRSCWRRELKLWSLISATFSLQPVATSACFSDVLASRSCSRSSLQLNLPLSFWLSTVLKKWTSSNSWFVLGDGKFCPIRFLFKRVIPKLANLLNLPY